MDYSKVSELSSFTFKTRRTITISEESPDAGFTLPWRGSIRQMTGEDWPEEIIDPHLTILNGSYFTSCEKSTNYT